MAKECRECGKPLAGLGLRQGAVFCSTPCRKAWNNRRMVRGQELYDVVMAMRYERDAAKAQQAFSVLANLARAYRDSDMHKRGGRQSWNLNDAMARLPIAFSDEGDKR